MISVYFGPRDKSPAGELADYYRTLWFTEFHLLAHVRQDFWTNNPLALDVFDPEQVMVRLGDGWAPLPGAADALLAGWRDDPEMSKTSPGKLALACDLVTQMIASGVNTAGPAGQ